MITLIELREWAREWSLRDDIVEKDYVLGWLLWGIASHTAIGQNWVFKGGTCLKKCYFETYRFSEDLDFTVLENGPHDPTRLREVFEEIADRIYEESGIEIPRDHIRFEAYRTGAGARAVEGRLYYSGPRKPGGDLPRIKIDLTIDEVVVTDPVNREIVHPYSDGLPGLPRVACYSLPEIFAEKLRALAERCLPRDLFDVINIFRRSDLRHTPDGIRGILQQKCLYKEMPITTLATIERSPRRPELETEWENMLAHQLPELPPLDPFLAELAELFGWLEERRVEPEPLPAFPVPGDVEPTWSPPATVSTWGLGVPLESIRFAGANRLCIDLGYQGTVRRVEPYSLWQTNDGYLILSAVRRDSREPRSYRVDRIESVKVTKEPFTPIYPVEFWPSQVISAAPIIRRPSSRSSRGSRRTHYLGPRYVVQCTYCGKRFTRRDTRLQKHKMKGQSYDHCPGRVGFIVRTA